MNTLKLGLVLASSVAVGAQLARADDAAPLFSHQFHLEEAGAECGGCHVDVEGKRLPQLNLEHCVDCHDEAPAWRLETRGRELAAAFPHRVHEGVGECAECHAGVPQDKIVSGAPVVEQVGCDSCHDEQGAELPAARCAACHGRDERAAPPADHAKPWRARHGTEARWRVFDQHGQDCQQCHGRDACTGCHRERRPTDHSALWRVRMHGSAASWDRDRCKTCHETGACVRCHRSSTPMSHRGAWASQHGRAAGGFDSNCTICHQRAWCVACHNGASR